MVKLNWSVPGNKTIFLMELYTLKQIHGDGDGGIGGIIGLMIEKASAGLKISEISVSCNSICSFATAMFSCASLYPGSLSGTCIHSSMSSLSLLISDCK